MIKPNMSDEEKKKILEELLSENTQTPNINEGIINYTNLDIEPGKKDTWLKYGESLKELIDKNYERHLMPWESFGLIIDYLEDNLSGDLKILAKDMVEGYGEWFNLFMKKEGDKLFCYSPKMNLVPEDVKWNSDSEEYEVNDNKLKINKEFLIRDIPSEEFIDLKQFPKDFVKYIYTKEFDELPEQMKKGNRKAQIYLPPENVLWPVGRGDYYYGRFGVACCGDRASRGVRKKFSTRNKG